MKKILLDLYRRMHRHYGPTRWWPGDTPFEIAVGAILTQNTAWTNVERAIANLKKEKLLSPRAIINAPSQQLESALRPSGYFRQKADRLRTFSRFLLEHHRGSIRHMARTPLDRLRPQLLALHGIGPETADDILLYACHLPVFVIDAYTRRILARHALLEKPLGYEALRALFESQLPANVGLYQEYHALLVLTAKDYCRARPDCERCPLKPLLPADGPRPG